MKYDAVPADKAVVCFLYICQRRKDTSILTTLGSSLFLASIWSFRVSKTPSGDGYIYGVRSCILSYDPSFTQFVWTRTGYVRLSDQCSDQTNQMFQQTSDECRIRFTSLNRSCSLSVTSGLPPCAVGTEKKMRRFFRRANTPAPSDSPPEIDVLPSVPATPPPLDEDTIVVNVENGQVLTHVNDLVEILLPDDASAAPSLTPPRRRGVFGGFTDWFRRVFGSKRNRGNAPSGQDLEKAQRELDTIPEESETDEELKTRHSPHKLVRYDIPVVVVHDPNI